MSEEKKDESEPGAIHAGKAADGPLELGREPATKGDLASTAHWLEERRGQAQADVTQRVERHGGALRVTNDHLVLIRSDLAGLLGEMSKGFDAAGRDRDRLRSEIRNRRGRIRLVLAALVGFALGLAVSADRVLGWIQSFGGAG